MIWLDEDEKLEYSKGVRVFLFPKFAHEAVTGHKVPKPPFPL